MVMGIAAMVLAAGCFDYSTDGVDDTDCCAPPPPPAVTHRALEECMRLPMYTLEVGEECAGCGLCGSSPSCGGCCDCTTALTPWIPGVHLSGLRPDGSPVPLRPDQLDQPDVPVWVQLATTGAVKT